VRFRVRFWVRVLVIRVLVSLGGRTTHVEVPFPSFYARFKGFGS
jgi:hypothetical protein